ncbi:MAG: PqqD family peptide modification chaperone [Atopobiaceae bacterium]|nr:PqqD family peptide modification chaperone [Atopobiaceae bacterium]
MGDEIIAVPVGSGSSEVKGVLRLNNSANTIVQLLTDEISKEQIVSRLVDDYEDDSKSIDIYVQEVLSLLNDAGLLVK